MSMSASNCSRGIVAVEQLAAPAIWSSSHWAVMFSEFMRRRRECRLSCSRSIRVEPMAAATLTFRRGGRQAPERVMHSTANTFPVHGCSRRSRVWTPAGCYQTRGFHEKSLGVHGRILRLAGKLLQSEASAFLDKTSAYTVLPKSGHGNFFNAP